MPETRAEKLERLRELLDALPIERREQFRRELLLEDDDDDDDPEKGERRQVWACRRSVTSRPSPKDKRA